MSMNTFLPGRLRNTSLPYNQGLLPLFETVINSIHAIEDTELNNGKIVIEILRDIQTKIKFDKREKKRGPDT